MERIRIQRLQQQPFRTRIKLICQPNTRWFKITSNYRFTFSTLVFQWRQKRQHGPRTSLLQFKIQPCDMSLRFKSQSLPTQNDDALEQMPGPIKCKAERLSLQRGASLQRRRERALWIKAWFIQCLLNMGLLHPKSTDRSFQMRYYTSLYLK